MRTKALARFCGNLSSAVITILITVNFLMGCASRRVLLHIENPYANVNWTKHGRYKANLHTHTSAGEADNTPQDVIDRYKELGYSILALTDHDDDVTAEPTWPWQAYDRKPEDLDMVAIQGNEISALDDIGSLFNDYGNPDVQSEEEAIKEIGRRGGIAVFNHPGRYERTVEWYVDMYQRYNHLIGLEIYNKRDRYPGDRQKWDAILSEVLPERSVWGVANDDMHKLEGDIGFSWNLIILPELTSDLVQQSLEKGCFFFVHAPKGQYGKPIPIIKAIIADERSGFLQIKASGHEHIIWVSQGNIVHQGNRLNLIDLPDVQKYVRAEVHGPDDTVIGTQPFIIVRTETKK
jgi:hypothetical protein